ncbi:MAG: hypothetical protein GDA43_21480 [Hormoscilla sp. SP5CHS1]|nr:hypothetical protein [Hormoscilla sp. SP5CHS1]
MQPKLDEQAFHPLALALPGPTGWSVVVSACKHFLSTGFWVAIFLRFVVRTEVLTTNLSKGGLGGDPQFDPDQHLFWILGLCHQTINIGIRSKKLTQS